MTQKTITNYQVSVAEVKKQLNIDLDFTEDDDYIQVLIEAATDYISGEISADVEVTENKLTIKDPGNVITVHQAPLIEVDSIVADEIELTEIEVTPSWTCFDVALPDAVFAKVELTFRTGHLNLPAGLKQAIIIKAASLYDQERSTLVIGASVSKTNVIDSLVTKYKRRHW